MLWYGLLGHNVCNHRYHGEVLEWGTGLWQCEWSAFSTISQLVKLVWSQQKPKWSSASGDNNWKRINLHRDHETVWRHIWQVGGLPQVEYYSAICIHNILKTLQRPEVHCLYLCHSYWRLYNDLNDIILIGKLHNVIDLMQYNKNLLDISYNYNYYWYF